jgi:Tol biopolymer transport system component
MPLANGTKLGPYQIAAPLGAGGMGEVYRARDTRLDRTVAVKVLPSQLASAPEARQRFEREARAVAALNHPHICTLHDVGSQDGTEYLVMEYLEGETLEVLLKKGPLPLSQVLNYGAEIADSLDKAHRLGIIHRDLKPGNIMITKSGTKLLDFGLAKAAAQLATEATRTAAATPATPLTVQGAVLGTFRYMSPEQVQGNDVDARSDIFSFGSVLYEMVTGLPAFPGKSQLSVASEILEKQPSPVSTLQPLTPPALDRTIRVCLAKDPENRWQTARDLLLELNWIAEGGGQFAPVGSPETHGTLGRRNLFIALGALLLGAAVASLIIWNRKPAAPLPVTRTVITLPAGQRLAGLDQPALALSPDGAQLAYVAVAAGKQQLYLRALDSLESRPVPGTEGAISPFFSPDSQWLGFFADGKLKKIQVNGGVAQVLSDAVLPRGASWGSNGIIAFAPSGGSVLQQIHGDGGTPQALTHLEPGEPSHRWPEFLPGGKAVIFTTGQTLANWMKAEIAVELVGTGQRKELLKGATQPRYAHSGHLIYAEGANLMAVPFDPRSLALTGSAVPVVEGVRESTSTGATQFSISPTGSLVYTPGIAQADQRRMVWVTREGVEQPLASPAHAYRGVRLSPDGRLAATAVDELETQVWQYDLTRETLTRLTFQGSIGSNPVWTPDGKRMVFSSNKEGPVNLFWQLADGSGGVERLTTSDYINTPMSWSPDGQLLAFVEINPVTGYDIWLLRLSDRKAQPLIRTPFNESAPRFSPDGRWLAYVSNESGRWEIYVQPFPGPGGKSQISAGGGTEPVWNHNGRELFYRDGDKMMAVDIATQPGFSAGKPRELFEGHYEPSPGSNPNYDVSLDGRRFLMVKPTEQKESSAQIVLVLNWFEELRRRVPATK